MKKFFVLFAFSFTLALSAAGKPMAVFGHAGDLRSMKNSVIGPSGIVAEYPDKWLSPDEMNKYSVIYIGERRPKDFTVNSALENFVKNGGIVIFTGGSVVSLTGKSRDLSAVEHLLGFKFIANMNKVKVSAVQFDDSPLAAELKMASKKFNWNSGFNTNASKITSAKVIAYFISGNKKLPAVLCNKVGKGEVWWIGTMYARYASNQKNTGYADEEGRFILTESGKNLEALKLLYTTIFRRAGNLRNVDAAQSSWGTVPLRAPGNLKYAGKFKNSPTYRKAPVLKNRFKLSENGSPLAVIVSSDRKLRAIAGELQYHLNAITGGKFQIVAKPLPGKAAIILDNTAPSARVIVKTGKDTVTIKGDISMGVYYLLEKLGCRYLWPGKLGKVIPSKPTLWMPDVQLDTTPMLKLRRIRHGGGGSLGERGKLGLKRCGITDEKAFLQASRAARTDHRGNGSFYTWHGIGGSLPYSWGHAFGSYYKLYGKTNPDFFALQPNGSRSQQASPDRPRLCMSNEKLIKHIAAELIAKFNKRPGAQALSVCLNDGGRTRFCMCEGCRKLDPVNGAPLTFNFMVKGIPTAVKYVYLTDRVIHFSNRIAEEVNKVLPGKKVCVYIYSCYSAPPSAVKPSPQLVLFSTAMSYTTDAARAKSLTTLAKLSEFGNELFWRPNALAGFRSIVAPQNYARRMFEDTELLKFNNSPGMDFDCNEQHWACKGLIYYTLSKAMWNPDRLSYDDIVDDYCTTGFGKAAGKVKEYFTRLEKIFDAAASKAVGYCEVFNQEQIAQLNKILDEAENLADTPVEKERVRFLKLGLEAGSYPSGLYHARKAKNTALYRDIQKRYRAFLQRYAIESPLVINPCNAGFRSTFTFR